MIILFAFPAMDFLKITIGYLQRQTAKKTEKRLSHNTFHSLNQVPQIKWF